MLLRMYINALIMTPGRNLEAKCTPKRRCVYGPVEKQLAQSSLCVKKFVFFRICNIFHKMTVTFYRPNLAQDYTVPKQ